MIYKTALFFLLYMFSFSLNAQTEKVSDTIQNKKTDTLQVLDRVPIFPGCNKFTENSDLSKCMSDKFRKFISKKFDTSIVDTLDLAAGRHTIKTWFKINKEGNITDINVDAPHLALEKEAKRVLALFPRIIPGEQKEKKVIVPYYIPIYISTLGEEDEKESGFSRKQKRRFLKEARKKIKKMN